MRKIETSFSTKIKDFHLKNSFIKKIINTWNDKTVSGAEESVFLVSRIIPDGFKTSEVNLNAFKDFESRRDVVDKICNKFGENGVKIDLLGFVLNGFSIVEEISGGNNENVISSPIAGKKEEVLLFSFIDFEGNKYFRIFSVNRRKDKISIAPYNNKHFSDIDGWLLRSEKDEKRRKVEIDGIMTSAWNSYKMSSIMANFKK